MRPHSVGVNLTPATKTTIFTVPTRSLASWKVLYAINRSATAKEFSCWWYDVSTDTEIAITDAYSLTAKNFFLLGDGNYIVLDEGDEIRAESETGSNTSIIITVELDNRSTVQNFA